jgi:hypothetical protein
MPAVVGTIVDRLRELGYVEGRNGLTHERWTPYQAKRQRRSA